MSRLRLVPAGLVRALADRAKPWARAVKHWRLYRRALREARRADREVPHTFASEPSPSGRGASEPSSPGRGQDAGELRDRASAELQDRARAEFPLTRTASPKGRGESQTSSQAGGELPPIAFIFGCGRSGTTILGKVFGQHPHVRYFFEPYHVWAAIDPRADMLGLYVRNADAHCLMNGAGVNEMARRRFDRLIRREGAKAGGVRLVIEKTPINALRIGYLEALAPDAKYVHIVRDGVDVCRSIDRIAVRNRYRIAGKPDLNSWWGVADSKWKALARDGHEAGYYADEAGEIENSAQRGAYEWLLSLREVDRWRHGLGARLFEFSYEELTGEPRGTLLKLCGFLGIGAEKRWLETSAAMIDAPRRNAGDALVLPAEMAQDFNRYQARYGFGGRAVEQQSGRAAEQQSVRSQRAGVAR